MMGNRFGHSVNSGDRGEFQAVLSNAQGYADFEISDGEAFDDGIPSLTDDLEVQRDRLRSVGGVTEDPRLAEMERKVIVTHHPDESIDFDASEVDEIYEAAIRWAEDEPDDTVEFDVQRTPFGWAVTQYDQDGDREWNRYYGSEKEAKLAVISYVEKEMDFDREEALAPTP